MSIVGIIFFSISMLLLCIAFVFSLNITLKAIRTIADSEIECPDEPEEIESDANIPEEDESDDT